MYKKQKTSFLAPLYLLLEMGKATIPQVNTQYLVYMYAKISQISVYNYNKSYWTETIVATDGPQQNDDYDDTPII